MANEKQAEQITIEQVANEKELPEEHKEEVTEVTNMDAVRMNIANIDNAFASMDSFKSCYMIGKYFAQSSLVPQAYQNKPMDCAIAVDIANRMGVSPMFVMQNLYVVRGVPNWSGQACMGIIRSCGRFENVKPVYIGNPDDETWGCYISAIDKATGQEIKGTEITMKMAKSEGWLSNTKWKNMPQQMLAYRAATFFARIYAPNELMGFRTEGEPEDAMAKPPVTRGVDPFKEAEKNV